MGEGTKSKAAAICILDVHIIAAVVFVFKSNNQQTLKKIIIIKFQ